MSHLNSLSLHLLIYEMALMTIPLLSTSQKCFVNHKGLCTCKIFIITIKNGKELGDDRIALILELRKIWATDSSNLLNYRWEDWASGGRSYSYNVTQCLDHRRAIFYSPFLTLYLPLSTQGTPETGILTWASTTWLPFWSVLTCLRKKLFPSVAVFTSVKVKGWMDKLQNTFQYDFFN